MPLSAEEKARYSRHILLPEVGIEGQERLKNARILIVGAGGLGSPAALYLAAAGVGKLGIADADRVDVSNLQRQILYSHTDAGRLKIEAAKDRLTTMNPNVSIEIFPSRIDKSNALDIIGGFDIVVDGTDNIFSRYLLNDTCYFLKKPYIYGAIQHFEGQVSIFCMPNAPCYRCFFREPPPETISSTGVLGVLPGIIGTIQAAEALKILLGAVDKGGETLSGRLLLLDAWTMEFRTIPIKKSKQCPLCGTNPTIKHLMSENYL